MFLFFGDYNNATMMGCLFVRLDIYPLSMCRFVISSRNDVLSALDEDIKASNEISSKLKSSFDYNQRQARETESYIRELLESSPALAKKILGDDGTNADGKEGSQAS